MCEYTVEPLAVDITAPRLSWINIAGRGVKGQKQTAWQMQVAGSPEKLASGEADLWDSGKVPGDESVLVKYASLAERTADAFHKVFYYPVAESYGKYGGNIFALRMGVPADRKDKVIASLKADIASAGGHLDTGINGTQFFFEVLAENGMNDLAYRAIDKRTFPGYGHWLEQGATTTRERWDGKKSRNHPMFGGGLVWLYRKLAGMDTDPARPGYRNIIFRPQPVGDVTYAEYSTRTPYGDAGIKWNSPGDGFTMDVTIPVGSTATVYVPALKGSKKKPKTDGKYVAAKGLNNDMPEMACWVYDISGSGEYSFGY